MIQSICRNNHMMYSANRNCYPAAKLSHGTKVSFGSNALTTDQILANATKISTYAPHCTRNDGLCDVLEQKVGIVIGNEKVQAFLQAQREGLSKSELVEYVKKLQNTAKTEVHDNATIAKGNETLLKDFYKEADHISKNVGVDAVQTGKHNGASYVHALNNNPSDIVNTISEKTIGVSGGGHSTANQLADKINGLVHQAQSAYNWVTSIGRPAGGHMDKETILTNTTKVVDNLSVNSTLATKNSSYVLTNGGTINIHIPTSTGEIMNTLHQWVTPIMDYLQTHLPEVLTNLHLIK